MLKIAQLLLFYILQQAPSAAGFYEYPVQNFFSQLTAMQQYISPQKAPTPTPNQQFVRRHENRKDYLRPCYFTNWAQYRNGRGKYVPEDYIPGLCTHMLFAFGWMNEDYTVRAFDPADLPNDWAGEGLFKRVNALKKRDPQLKTLLSIGGWSFGTRLFQQMARTPETRNIFIKSAIAFVRQWEFDGIDIDWEYPSGEEDIKNYVKFVTEMHAAIEEEAKQSNRAQLLLTAAVAAGKETIVRGYDIPQVAQALDFILLMNYDFHGAWSTTTGFNSPLYSRKDLPDEQKAWNVDWAANHWATHGMPKNKIVIGMATYGRGWTLRDVSNTTVGVQGSPARVTPFTQEAGVASYYELCDMLASGAKRYWHEEQKVPYLVKGDQWWSYDDEESIMLKLKYLKERGFGGAFVWTLDFDDFNAKCTLSKGQPYPLISLIAKELGGIEIPKNIPPPSPIVPSGPAVLPTTYRPPIGVPSGATAVPVPVPMPTTSKPSPTCAELSNGFHPVEEDCHAILLCLDKAAFHMRCPEDLHFSRSKKFCVKPKDSDCIVKVGTTTTNVTSTEEKYDCKSDGFYADVKNCKRFYRCVSGRGFSFECPNGLTFHSDSKMCDHPNPDKCGK